MSGGEGEDVKDSNTKIRNKIKRLKAKKRKNNQAGKRKRKRKERKKAQKKARKKEEKRGGKMRKEEKGEVIEKWGEEKSSCREGV